MDLLNTELRHIEGSHLTKLSSIIDTSKDWDKLLEELCRPQTRHAPSRPILNLSLDSINLIRNQLDRGKSPTFALLNHWAISGRRRPTLKSLLNLLRTCNLKWAENYLCTAVLDVDPPPERVPISSVNQQVAAIVQQPHLKIESEFKFRNLAELIQGIDSRVARYSFASIYESTNHFCHEPYDPVKARGSRIGEGRFSSVYRAATHLEGSSRRHSDIVAAKLLKSDCNMHFLTNEINLMFKVKNENILQLLGISLGSIDDTSVQYLCLIYDFIINGSLLECLSRGLLTRPGSHLNCRERLTIANKVAQGISYLHTSCEGPIIHRDIKTANIFIDGNLLPKIGDFTLVRLVESRDANETQYSQNIIGTSVYMPPEAFRGDISIKFDTFSYGIVLLEILTGRKPFDQDLDEDLSTFINEKLSDIEDENGRVAPSGQEEPDIHLAKDKFLKEILDLRVDDWNFASARSLFNMALRATENRKKDRPEVSSLLHELDVLCQEYF